ncbi:ketopantoate reductase PanE/ApbA-domain-containing protein [Aspergillus taichungensis]|uniref:Ketopantoate reductase PanE/ApbA-domain-containing protein n=1 Tax=Aspergillus taichungensis TaxID=482145 RepID=A0A2J5I827_9EURO|nr:ketopantoate reductase PanE/ApbA-domain-containing protein [Aspergillus taichungensis]
MAPPPRLRILSVGSNAISAFLAWRLQATASCDVTLVWKTNFESVAQYGVSFKSKSFGNERFKPRHVVRSPEEAASRENAYDYVILCVKALPDVYDLAAVIESVVTPQHTCILLNTTNTIGVESHLEQRFPTNVVLSLVSGVEVSQIGASEFEHLNSSDIWVGATTKQSTIPSSIQNDMAAALAMTLATGQVECKVSENIRQEQFERMIGPIAFYPTSVMFDTPNHSQLLEKIGVRPLVTGIIDELLRLGKANGCSFPDDFAEKVIEKMTANGPPSTMYQDFQSRRPMEVETYLGSPVKLALEAEVPIPRLETLYAALHHVNTTNLTKPRASESPPLALAQPPPRLSSAPAPRMMNGHMRPGPGGRPGPPGMMPPMRRGPSGGPMPMPGPMSRPPSTQPPQGKIPREPSLEGLEEFSHLVLYDDAQDGALPPTANGNGFPDTSPGGAPSQAELALRERELALRQRELQFREQEMNMRRGPPRPRPPPSRAAFDEEDEDDFFDPMESLPVPQIDPDNVDMMSITSRRAKKAPSASQIRRNPEMNVNGGGPGRPGSSFRNYFGRKRTSDRIMQEIPGLHDSLLDNPMMAYSSNRYGSVDRNQMNAGSRANSLTASRMGDYPPHPHPQSRRNSHSPATPFGPPGPGPRMGRPPNGPDGNLGPPNGYPPRGGHPSPPGQMRAPVPRYPPGQGNAVGPQQVEQHYGVSNSFSAKPTPKHRSLTGSASASAESGDSGASANIDSGNSAHSSQISLGAQQASTPVP